MSWLALGLFVAWFLVIFVVRSVVQKRSTGDSGIRAGALAESATTIETVAGWTLVAAFIAGLAAPILGIAGVPQLWNNSTAEIVGVVVVVVGIALTFLAQVDMGSEWRIGIDTEERTGLVTNGWFAFVRNPIFTAMMLTASGFVLMVPNIIAVIAFVSLVVAIELQVRYVEEPHLHRLHGNDYRDYASHVGRFLPLIGRTGPA